MLITIILRRDADGSTEELEADLTVTDSALNVHPRRTHEMSDRDVLVLPVEAIRDAVTEGA